MAKFAFQIVVSKAACGINALRSIEIATCSPIVTNSPVLALYEQNASDACFDES